MKQRVESRYDVYGLLMCMSLCVAACGPQNSTEEPTLILDVPDMQREDAQMSTFIDAGREEMGVPDMSMQVDLSRDMNLPEDMPAQGCDPITTPVSLALSVGQGAIVELPQAYRITRVLGQMLTAQLDADDPSRVHVRAHYEAGTHVLELDLECMRDGLSATRLINVEVAALQVDYVEDWGDDNGPVRREHAPLLFHPDDPNALYMYGGLAYRPRQFTVLTDFWRFDRDTLTWSSIEVKGTPPAVSTGRFVYAESRSAFLTVGGDDPLESVANTDLYALTRDAQTGAWSWSNESIEGDLGHTLGALVYDKDEDLLVAALGFGGLGVTGYTFFDGAARLAMGVDTLAWEARVPDMMAPTPRYGFAYFMDPVTQRLIVTGGAQGLSTVNPAKDTWAYDWRTNVWEQLAEVNVGQPFGPSNNRHDGGRNSCWAFDPVHRRLFVWGGTPDGRTTSSGLYAMHLDEPGKVRWHAVSLDGFPPTRASCAGGYNPARGEVYFGFGNNDVGVYQDLVFVKVHEP